MLIQTKNTAITSIEIMYALYGICKIPAKKHTAAEIILPSNKKYFEDNSYTQDPLIQMYQMNNAFVKSITEYCNNNSNYSQKFKIYFL